jgi:hypothetical protein
MPGVNPATGEQGRAMQPTNRTVRGERDVVWGDSDGAGRGRLALTTSMGKDEQVLCAT